MAEKRILVVGSLNADLVVKVSRHPRPGETVPGSSFAQFPGGKGANQAVAAARLATAGVSVGMIGRVGADAAGAALRDGLAADGVDVSGIAADETAATGVAIISVDVQGQNEIIVVPGANERLIPGALSPHHAQIAGADVILLQLEIPFPTVQTVLRVGREKGATLILDPAPARALPEAVLKLCDFVTPNESELMALTGRAALPSREDVEAAARQLLARGARHVVVKLGAAGALLVTPEQTRHWPAPPVQAIDTTAAGDAWNGAFSVALAEGRSLDDAGVFACAAAALSVTRPGAQPSLPRRAELIPQDDPGGRD